MKRITLALSTLLLLLTPVFPQDLTPEEIIQKFVEKETEFSKVWQQYTYTQRILFQVLDDGGKAREEREVWVEVFFNEDGSRETRTVRDRGRLRSVGVTEEDLDDAIHRQPFVLTTDELEQYDIRYRGEEQVDELYAYVFDIKPKRKRKGERYFEGRLWVDDIDLQIVKTEGKVVPDYSDNKFPKFETLREQIDGEYWFPTWTEADDVLQFGSFGRGSRRVHIRELITYQDFKKFEVNTSIQYEPLEEPESDDAESSVP